MFKVSILEKEILDAMVRMSERNHVRATLKDIMIATGRETTGGIHTHSLHNLESMGLIRKLSKGHWIVLVKDISENGKGSRCVFEGVGAGVVQNTIQTLEDLKATPLGEVRARIDREIADLQFHIENYKNGGTPSKKKKSTKIIDNQLHL